VIDKGKDMEEEVLVAAKMSAERDRLFVMLIDYSSTILQPFGEEARRRILSKVAEKLPDEG